MALSFWRLHRDADCCKIPELSAVTPCFLMKMWRSHITAPSHFQFATNATWRMKENRGWGWGRNGQRWVYLELKSALPILQYDGPLGCHKTLRIGNGKWVGVQRFSETMFDVSDSLCWVVFLVTNDKSRFWSSDCNLTRTILGALCVKGLRPSLQSSSDSLEPLRTTLSTFLVCSDNFHWS